MKVYAKIRKKLICVSAGLFAVCLFFASVMSPYTQSKYIFEASDPDAKIEISVKNQIEITSVEQFKTAIENGYSNVKIADAVANPLLFIGNELDLKADLVIDLNGHELQRTGSDAMVNIPEGITLTIYDSDSADSNSLASLYNPVGSVIDISGGNLSLVGGKVESGVRANEYSTESAAARGSVSEALTATLYTKYVNGTSVSDGGYELTPDGYYAQTSAILPKISAATIKSGNYTLTDGNIYVPARQTLSSSTEYTYTFDVNNPLSVGGDYYLYYMNESNTYTAVSSGTADFYYEYTDNNGEEITICGFYKNFDKANSEDTTYAAIRMEDGKLSVFGGEYYQYFGVDNNYCVYATGGDMTVYGGAFVAEGYSTCLGCNFTGTDESGTLKVKAGEFTSYLGDGICVSGFAESMNDADDMTVTGGKFTKIADKTVSVGGQTKKDLGVGYASNGSAINMLSGKLTVQGASDQSQDDLIQFILYGGGVNGIKCGAGSFIDCKNAEFLFNCDYEGTAKNSSGEEKLNTNFTHNIGILNYAGNVTAENTLFRLNTAYNVGIYSTVNNLFKEETPNDKASGTVTAISSMFSLTGESSIGVLATRGTVNLGSEENLGTPGQDRYVMFYIDHVTDCMGVYVAGVKTSASVGDAERGKIDTSSATGDTATVNSIAAQFYLGQTEYEKETTAPEYYTKSGSVTEQRLFNSCGIYMNSEGNGSEVSEVIIGRTMIFSAGSYTAGIFVRSGEVEQKEINGKAYKFAALMGIRVENYGAGGQYDSTIDTEADHSSESAAGHYREKFGMTWYVAQYGADNYTAEHIFDVEQANAKGCYGINTLGGTIKMYNCYLGIYSTWSSGIYSLGGNVSIHGYDSTGDDGVIDSGLDCKIITFGASEKDETNANANIDANTNLSSPYSYEGAATGDRLITSCVVRMGNNSSSSGDYVYIGAGNIYTDNYGFYVEGGDLIFGSDDEGITSTIGNTEAETIIICYRAPAIVLKGGNIKVSENDTLQITDTLNADSVSYTYKDENDNEKKVTGDYKDFTADGTIPTDAVYVSGGNFTSSGMLNITFNGLKNDTSYTYYTSEVIKSYAVGVYSGDFKANASTSKLKVIVNTGGGVKVQGGGVILGNESVSDENLNTKDGNFIVIAKSLNPSDGKYTLGGVNSQTLKNSGTVATWQSYYNLYGGHALEVKGGDVIVYYGYYEAYYGNGLSVYSSSETSATVKIYDGTFYGWQNGTYDGDKDEFTSAVPYIGENRLCGPASYCGLRVIGNVDIYVYGGTFDGGNGGASVSGRLSPGGSDYKTANVYLYAGTFGNATSPTSQDGFCSYEYSNVVFGAYTRAELTKKYSDLNTQEFADSLKNLLKIYALGCAIAYSPMSDYADTSTSSIATMAVYYGTYYATNDDTGIANRSIFNIYNITLSLNKYSTLIEYNTYKGTFTKMSNSFALFYADSYFNYTGNDKNGDTITQTTNEDGTVYYANEYIKYEFTNASFATDWDQGSKLGTTTGTNATVKITCLADYLVFNANFGIWGGSSVTDSGVIKNVTVKVYSSDGTLKETVTVGYGYKSLTEGIILNKGDYILITANFSGTNYKVDLEYITYAGYVDQTADVTDEDSN